MSLKFSSEEEALQYLADKTGKQIRIGAESSTAADIADYILEIEYITDELQDPDEFFIDITFGDTQEAFDVDPQWRGTPSTGITDMEIEPNDGLILIPWRDFNIVSVDENTDWYKVTEICSNKDWKILLPTNLGELLLDTKITKIEADEEGILISFEVKDISDDKRNDKILS